uniref:Uncharacterized protein n=1 Tax=Setaria italica TaxID=4555 RepID=K3XP01_SETIT
MTCELVQSNGTVSSCSYILVEPQQPIEQFGIQTDSAYWAIGYWWLLIRSAAKQDCRTNSEMLHYQHELSEH